MENISSKKSLAVKALLALALAAGLTAVAVSLTPAKAFAGTGYSITVVPNQAGTATISPKYEGYTGGEEVTVTVKPNIGYKAVSCYATSVSPATVEHPSANTFKFTMPNPLDENVVVTIVYEQMVVKVTFDDNGGTGGIGQWAFTYGDTFEVKSVPTREGYTFLGYYDQKEGGNLYITADGRAARQLTYSADTPSMTLYAQWEAKGGIANTNDSTPLVLGGIALTVAAAGLVLAGRKLSRKEF